MDAPFHRSSFNQPLTYKALRRLALALGWTENKTQGKGSHRVFTRQGYREITLPCHRESQEYSRGFTRQLLQQILEPLADVCHVPLQGVHSVEQVEIIVQEMLEYLPAQVRQEYEKAIAISKSDLESYKAQEKAAIDQSLKDYEATRLQECENTIRELQSEQQLDWAGAYVLHQALIMSEQDKQVLQQKYSSVQIAHKQGLDQVESNQRDLLKLQQALEQCETSVEQLNRSLQSAHHKMQALRRVRKRDRLLLFGFLGLSVCLGTVLVHREATRPRSPSSMLLELQTSMPAKPNQAFYNQDTDESGVAEWDKRSISGIMTFCSLRISNFTM